MEVARRFNIARPTICCLAQLVRQTGTVADRPRPGQARVTSQRQDNYHGQCQLRDRFQTAAASVSVIIGYRGRRIHRKTVSRGLKEFGIRCRRPYHGPVLTRRHRQLRNNFAQNHQWRVNWHDVVFSDESRFNLYHNDGWVHVYRRNKGRYADNCNVERDRFGGGGVMVSGAINYNFQSRLLVFHGNLTTRSSATRAGSVGSTSTYSYAFPVG